MTELLKSFDRVSEKLTPSVLTAMSEIQQPRSKFQLEKFVISQHDTDEMRYFQCVTEIQALYYTIRTVSLEMKKTEIEIARLRKTKDEIDEIDAQLKELGLEQTRLVGIGAFRELEHLVEIFESFATKYTREQIENAQPDYWNKRLNRQATLEMAGGSQAAAAHLDSLRQIGAIEVRGREVFAVDPEVVAQLTEKGLNDEGLRS
jgi:hypothetical protein